MESNSIFDRIMTLVLILLMAAVAALLAVSGFMWWSGFMAGLAISTIIVEALFWLVDRGS